MFMPQVGQDLGVDAAAEAARLVAINLIATIKGGPPVVPPIIIIGCVSHVWPVASPRPRQLENWRHPRPTDASPSVVCALILEVFNPSRRA